MRRLLLGLLIATAAALALAGCGGTPAHPAATGDAAACKVYGGVYSNGTCKYAPSSAAATAVAAPQQTDPNGQTCPSLDSQGYCPGDDPSPWDAWCNGQGYSDYQTVQEDLSQIRQDSGNNLLGSVETDGQQLFADAATATQNLPPLSNKHKVDYGVWLGYLSVAGFKASNGDISGAASAMQSAAGLVSISDYVNSQCQNANGGTS